MLCIHFAVILAKKSYAPDEPAEKASQHPQRPNSSNAMEVVIA